MTTNLPNMGLTQPVVSGDFGTWGTEVNANNSLVDAHDHSPGKGPRVPTAGININADLSFASLYGPTNLHRITFASIVALSSSNKSLFVNTSDNELYWRSNTGVNVKLTSGSALNVAAFAGGIGGDYAAAGAALNFDSSGNRYTLKGAGGTTWTRMASGDVRLFETGTTDAVFVGLAAPAALAVSYTATWPLSPPASTSVVQMSSTGVLTSAATDAVSMGGTLTAAGLITGTVGVTAAVNQHVTVSGTGRLKHGSRELNVHAASYRGDSGAAGTFSSSGFVSSFTGAGTVVAWIPLEVGKRILTVQQFYSINATATGLTPRMIRVNHVTGAANTVWAGASDNTGGAGVIESQTSSALNHTVLSGEAYFFEVTIGTANHRVYGGTVLYDDP